MGGNNDVKLIIDGKRLDGRSPSDLRKIVMKAGILTRAEGSAYIEWGGNKVIAGIYGPRECIPKHGENPYQAVLKCKYSMSPFASKEDHGRAGPNRRSNELSKMIRHVFENVVQLEKYPRTQIDIFIDVLQAEGGTRVASIVAAALALADAGIPMKDMVSSVAVGKVDDTVILDLGKEEDNFGQSDMPVAFSNKTKEILLLQMDGLLTREEIEKGLDMAIKSSDELHKMQRATLEKMYSDDKE